jgi:hypothetical protein
MSPDTERLHLTTPSFVFQAWRRSLEARHTAVGRSPGTNEGIHKRYKYKHGSFKAAVIVDAFRKLDLAYPQVDEAKKEDLAAARQALMGGKK